MNYTIRYDSIDKKLPDDFIVPKSFLAFVDCCRKLKYGDLGFFSIQYSNPKRFFNSKEGKSAAKQLVPFLSLGDGGIAALWVKGKKDYAVIWLGSEGEQAVIARSLPDFLARMRSAKTRVPDLDDCREVEFPKIAGLSKTLQPLTAEKRKFDKWIGEIESESKHPESSLITKVSRELAKSLSKYRKRGDFDVEFVIDFSPRRFRVRWFDGGLKDCPHQETLRPLIEKLSQVLGRSFSGTSLSVDEDREVYLDGELLG